MAGAPAHVSERERVRVCVSARVGPSLSQEVVEAVRSAGFLQTRAAIWREAPQLALALL